MSLHPAIQAGLEALDQLDVQLAFNESIQEVNAKIQAIVAILAEAAEKSKQQLSFRVFERISCYANANHKNAEFRQYFTNNNTKEDQEYDEEAWQEEMKAYGLRDENTRHVRAGELSFIYVASMPPPVFTQSFAVRIFGENWRNREVYDQHCKRENNWHEFVMMFVKGKEVRNLFLTRFYKC